MARTKKAARRNAGSTSASPSRALTAKALREKQLGIHVPSIVRGKKKTRGKGYQRLRGAHMRRLGLGAVHETRSVVDVTVRVRVDGHLLDTTHTASFVPRQGEEDGSYVLHDCTFVPEDHRVRVVGWQNPAAAEPEGADATTTVLELVCCSGVSL